MASLSSSRPILSNRASRLSYNPSAMASASTVSTHGDERIQDMKRLSVGFEKLTSPKLQAQRYQPSTQKSDDLSKIALAAKVQRALDRRMSSQDAVMRDRSYSEKAAAKEKR